MLSWRRSAAYRIALANFLTFAIGLAVLGMVMFAAMHVAFTRQLDAAISDEARVLADEYRSGDPTDLSEAIAVRQSSSSPTRMLYALFSPDGRRIAGTLVARRPKLGMHDIQFIDSQGAQDWARGIAIDLSPRERLLVAADREWIEQIDQTIMSVFAAAFLVACLMALGGAFLFGSYLKGRLSAISDAAKTIIAGDIRERMPVSRRDDEFDHLASTLNRMLDRIEGLLDNLRQVSSDVAHDLRTPLSRLRTLLERGQQAPDNLKEIIDGAVIQLDDVLSLFAAILRIAEVEAGETRRYFTAVNISALATELAESYAPAIQDQEQILLWSIEPDLSVYGDRQLLAQAAINLIENAQRHTPAGTVIRMTLIAIDDTAHLQVIDNGPGVATADLPRMVKRFARLETSRTTAGYGLGLNLVSAVARLHGGRLLLKNNAPGLSATIELPVLRPAELRQEIKDQ